MKKYIPDYSKWKREAPVDEIPTHYLTVMDDGPIGGCKARVNVVGFKPIPKEILDRTPTDLTHYFYALTADIERTTQDFVLGYK